MARIAQVLASVALILSLPTQVACDGAAKIDPADTMADTTDDTASDSVATTDSATDTAADTTPEGVFVLGTHPQGANDPSLFEVVGEGDPLEVQFGFQGLWMVLLAFKQKGMLEGDLFLTAEMTVNGTSQGTLSLAEQKMAAGPEGFTYYYNFFLVVDDPTVGGETGVITFTANDDVGGEVTLVRTVQLTGGE